VNNKRKRMLQDIKRFPFYYKICEACDNVNAKDTPFCIFCGNYRFDESIVRVSKRAEEMLTETEDPLEFLE